MKQTVLECFKGSGSQSVKFLAGTEDFDLKLKEVIELEQKTKTINKKDRF